MTTKMLHYSDLAIPPGDTLADELAERKLSRAELARRMKRPVQAVSEIVNGRKRITADTALDLERVLAVPAELWMNLQTHYDLTLARQRRS